MADATDQPMSRLTRLRRTVHAHPELGFLEIETAALIVQALEPAADSITYGSAVCRASELVGLPSEDELAAARARALQCGVPRPLVEALADGNTGVVVTNKGNRPGPVTAMRFDMDALPLEEASSDSHAPALRGFRSAYDGIMHACGHDGHVAVGIELGLRLAEDNDFAGEARLLFQPAEEGVRGARAMLGANVTRGVDRMVGLHLGLGLPVGTVAASAEGLMATEKWRVTLIGRAAHAALAPEQGRHAILGAATAALGLHSLTQVAGAITRVNVGAIHGGTSANIVPDRAELLVELRADSAAAFEDLRERARAVVMGATMSHGLQCDVQLTGQAATIRCNDTETDALLRAATRVPAIEVALRGAPMTASDDVTLLMDDVQRNGGTATLVLVGAGSPAPHHHPSFDLDERCLPLAVDWLEAAVRDTSTAT